MTGGAFNALLRLETAGADRFVVAAAGRGRARAYGGQFLAQGLAACQATVAGDRDVHSLHACFLRPGDVALPVDLEVERVRDGRSFSARSVRVLQNGREVFRLLASFHVAEAGADYAHATAPRVPPPDAVSTTYDGYRAAGSEERQDATATMEIRYVNPPLAPAGVPVLDDQRTWMRLAEPLGDDPRLHAAGLAFLADSTLIDHVALVHGRRWQDAGLEGVSLDHAMWFHRRARVDRWLLFDQRVEATGGARGLASGRIFDDSGLLVATCVQEGLTRWQA